jgi:hypothetical protein
MQRMQTWVGRLLLTSLFVGLIVPSTVVPPAHPVEAIHESYTNTIAPNGLYWTEIVDKTDSSIAPGNLSCRNPGKDFNEGSGAARVGFGHARIVDSAGSGFFQDCRINSVREARLTFDVNEFKKHPLAEGVPVYAWLSYDENYIARTDPMPRGSQGMTCVSDLFIAASANPHGRDGLFDVGEQLGRIPMGHDGAPLNSDPWDISYALRGWIDGSIPNFGVVLTGFDEGFERDDNQDCTSELKGIELKVIVFWDVAAADLAVSNISIADKSGVPGCVTGTVNVGVTAENWGDAPASLLLELRVNGEARMQLYAGGLAAKSTSREQFDDITLATGINRLEILVDPDGEVNEDSEVNNSTTLSVTCAVGAAPTATPAPSDLSISKLDVQQSGGVSKCVAGSQNAIQIIVKNDGDKEVGGVFGVKVRVDGKDAGSTTVGGVGAKSEKTSYVSGVNIPSGNHTVQAILDPENKVLEGGEGNNSRSIQVNCTQN